MEHVILVHPIFVEMIYLNIYKRNLLRMECTILPLVNVNVLTGVEAGKELIWMKNFLSELRMKQAKFLLHCDNQCVIHVAKNIVYHTQVKHIQIRYPWLREKVDDREFTLVKIYTYNTGSNMLMKNLRMDRPRVYRQKTTLHDSFP